MSGLDRSAWMRVKPGGVPSRLGMALEGVRMARDILAPRRCAEMAAADPTAPVGPKMIMFLEGVDIVVVLLRRYLR